MEWLKMRGRLASGWSRYFLVLLAGLLVSVFAVATTNTTPISAQSTPDATWSEGSITRGGDTYVSVIDGAVISAMGYPAGTKVFTTSYDTSTGAGQQTIKAISFPPNVNPEEATSANHTEYSFTPPRSWTKGSSTTISIAGPSGGSDDEGQDESGTDCALEGVGWMLCGPSMWIAKGMDTVYGWMEEFLRVRPLEVSNNKSMLFQAWDIVRGIANTAFIIAFLIIIYSQVTSMGISNYGIKRMLPRLIIAALMVNLSYYICALAIDLSNILGISIKDSLDGILANLASNGQGNTEGMFSTSSLIQAFLSGGAIAVGAGVATGASLQAGTPFVIPLLLTLFISLLVAMLVLAARQAMIIILTIISPLAFVAYLLPGTEKWFEKWRSVFFTMMIFFPAFAIVFSGANLAGYIITHNASSLVMYVLGWAVQLAPLAITPLILKLGGGILNRFAGIVNNPSKGVIDKSKQWAEKKSRDIANRRTYGNDKLTNLNFARKGARYLNRKSRLLDDRIAESDMRAENSYRSWSKAKDQDIAKRDAEMDKQQVDQEAELAWNRHIQRDTKAIEKDLKLRVTVDKAELEKMRLDNRYVEFKSGYQPFTGPMSRSMTDLIDRAQQSTRDIAIESLRKSSAERVQNDQLAKAINEDPSLQAYAGKMEDLYFGGNRGSQRALATSLQAINSANEDAIKNAQTIINGSNLSDDELVKMVNGESQRNIMLTDDIRTAAIRKIAGGKNAFAINSMLDTIDFDKMPSEFQQELGAALLDNGAKPPWIGGLVSGEIKKGNMSGMSRDLVVKSMKGAINNGKISAEVLVSTDASYLNNLKDTMETDTTFFANITRESIQELKDAINLAKTDSRFSGRIGERSKPIDDILSKLP